MTSKPSEEKSVLGRWLDKLRETGFGEARDDLLVAAGVVYGTGYAVWALHASRYNLGLLPAFESQYFIAGFLPTAGFLLAYKITIFAEKKLELARERLGPDAEGLRKKLRNAIRSAFGVAMMLVFISSLDDIKERLPGLSGVAFQIGLWLFMVSFLFLPEDRQEGNAPKTSSAIDRAFFGFFRGLRLFLIRYVGVSLALLGTIFYSEKVHPFLPQEFGGGRPRCASLDLTRAQLSDQTLDALVSGEAPRATDQVTRSVVVDVFFAGSDYLLVKPRERAEDARMTYEIRRAAAQTVMWCK